MARTGAVVMAALRAANADAAASSQEKPSSLRSADSGAARAP